MKRLIILCLFILGASATFAQVEYVNNLEERPLRAHAFVDVGMVNPSFGNSAFLAVEGNITDTVGYRLEGAASIGYAIPSDHYMYNFGTSRLSGRAGIGITFLNRHYTVPTGRVITRIDKIILDGLDIDIESTTRNEYIPGERRMGAMLGAYYLPTGTSANGTYSAVDAMAYESGMYTEPELLAMAIDYSQLIGAGGQFFLAPTFQVIDEVDVRAIGLGRRVNFYRVREFNVSLLSSLDFQQVGAGFEFRAAQGRFYFVLSGGVIQRIGTAEDSLWQLLSGDGGTYGLVRLPEGTSGGYYMAGYEMIDTGANTFALFQVSFGFRLM